MNENNIPTQTKILRAIILNGGKANTKEISEATGMSINRVNRSTFHLVNRYLVTRKYDENYVDARGVNNKIKVFTIREQKREKIMNMITEAYGESQ